MKEKEYYSKTGFVSSTSIGYFDKSPSAFKAFIDGELKESEASYQGYGKLVHLKLLEPFEYDSEVVPHEFNVPKSAQQKKFMDKYLELLGESSTPALVAYKESYSTKETDDKILEKANKLLEEFKPYREYLKLSKERTVIKKEVHEKIKESDRNARSHKLANELLFGVSDIFDDGIHRAYNELELYFINPETKIKYKGMLDRIVIDNEAKTVTLVDVKTSNGVNAFKESFEKYNYARQLAFYEMLIKNNRKKLEIDEDYTIQFYIVAVSSITSEVKVYNVQSEVESARNGLADTLAKIKWHFINDRWEHTSEYYNGDGSEKL